MDDALFDYSAQTTRVVSVMFENDESADILQENIASYDLGAVDENYEELIYQEQKVTNEFLGHMFALQIFGLGMTFCILLYKLIKNNVTRFI